MHRPLGDRVSFLHGESEKRGYRTLVLYPRLEYYDFSTLSTGVSADLCPSVPINRTDKTGRSHWPPSLRE